jgi:hypothetical protein
MGTYERLTRPTGERVFILGILQTVYIYDFKEFKKEVQFINWPSR